MEQQEQQTSDSHPSYWQSVFIVGVVFAFLIAIGQLIEGYMSINRGESVGWVGTVFCLLTAFGGLTAVWHYLSEYQIGISLGKGALIGFLVGFIAQVLGLGIIEIWQMIDPSYAEGIKQIQIAEIENNETLPEAWKQRSIDMIHDPGVGMILLTNVGSALITGILNLITGMIGAKVFGNDEKEF